jgi:hypothetical protein
MRAQRRQSNTLPSDHTKTAGLTRKNGQRGEKEKNRRAVAEMEEEPAIRKDSPFSRVPRPRAI